MNIVWEWTKYIWNMPKLRFIYQTLYRVITGRVLINRVFDGLYMSSKFKAKDYRTLIDLNIGAIIDLEGGMDLLPIFIPPEDFKYWPIKDKLELPDLTKLNEVVQWGYDRWREGKDLLVHCAAGHNRSGLVAALILVKKGWAGKKASEWIQERAPGGLANPVFRKYVESL